MVPIYEYGCNDCGTKFEKLVKISDTNIPECPKCDGDNVKKAFSTFGIGGCPNTGAKAESKKPPCGDGLGNGCCAGCGA